MVALLGRHLVDLPLLVGVAGLSNCVSNDGRGWFLTSLSEIIHWLKAQNLSLFAPFHPPAGCSAPCSVAVTPSFLHPCGQRPLDLLTRRAAAREPLLIVCSQWRAPGLGVGWWRPPGTPPPSQRPPARQHKAHAWKPKLKVFTYNT